MHTFIPLCAITCSRPPAPPHTHTRTHRETKRERERGERERERETDTHTGTQKNMWYARTYIHARTHTRTLLDTLGQIDRAMRTVGMVQSLQRWRCSGWTPPSCGPWNNSKENIGIGCCGAPTVLAAIWVRPLLPVSIPLATCV